MALTTHPYLAPKLKSRAIPLLPLWVYMASSRVNFTFTLPFYINNQKCTILWLELLAELTVHVFLSKQLSCLWSFSYWIHACTVDLSACCVIVTVTYSQSDLIKHRKCLWFVKLILFCLFWQTCCYSWDLVGHAS